MKPSARKIAKSRCRRRTEVISRTGHLTKFDTQAYKVRDDDLWLLPTGEVALMGLSQGEILGVGPINDVASFDQVAAQLAKLGFADPYAEIAGAQS